MKTKLLLYCTKGKPYLFNRIIKGKIVAECECEVEEIEWWSNSTYDDGYFNKFGKNITKEICEKGCLTYEQLFELLGGVNNGYALHLANIKAFEKPFRIKYVKDIEMNALTKAPQNMCWVWYKGQKYVLISIRPEWLCKILNREKTIEVRRKILKGMM